VKARVLHICSDTNIGGAGRYVLTLLTQRAVTERWEVAVACPEGQLAAALRRAGVTVLLYEGADVSFSWQSLTSLVRLMRTWRPRIVQSHGSLAGRIAATLAGARIIYTKHGLAAAEEQAIQVRTPGTLLKRAAVRLFAHRIVAVSEAVKRSLVGAGADPERVRVIPGGIELETYATVAPPVPGVVATLGRLSREKGMDVLVEAMAQLKGEARLVIGGDGPQREALVQQVQALGLQESVTFAGFVDDVPAFMGQTGLFVSASRSEGLGLVILEAMAAGRPVVGTQVGGVPEVVVDGETGILVSPEDPAALACAIRRILGDPALAQRLGAAGRKRVDEVYSAGHMARLSAALYEELATW
jgi:glycosyltransferase involved in cell wall biosynthesis